MAKNIYTFKQFESQEDEPLSKYFHTKINWKFINVLEDCAQEYMDKDKQVSLALGVYLKNWEHTKDKFVPIYWPLENHYADNTYKDDDVKKSFEKHGIVYAVKGVDDESTKNIVTIATKQILAISDLKSTVKRETNGYYLIQLL